MLSRLTSLNIRMGWGNFSFAGQRKCSSTTEKTKEQISKLKKELDEKEENAINLIFGNRSYSEFKPEEKELVDWYQDRVFKEAPVILPNTKKDWEEQQAEKLLDEFNQTTCNE